MNKKVLKLCHISAILAIADMVKLEFHFIAHSTISLKGLYHLQHTTVHTIPHYSIQHISRNELDDSMKISSPSFKPK